MNKPKGPGAETLDNQDDQPSLAEAFDETRGSSTKRRSGVHLLPNILTTGTLIAGFFTIISSVQGDFLSASYAIFVAMAFDATDGRVARWTNTQSQFGMEYDSLSDMVAFGIAPAVLMYSWGLPALGDWGWLAASLYVLATSLRLARFNVHDVSEWPGHYFQGLPSPAAAALVATTVWAMVTSGYVGAASATVSTGILSALFLLTASVGMMSRFPYLSFKGFDVKDKVPVIGLLLTAFGISTLIFLPPIVLMFMAIIFMFSGPVIWLLGIGKKNETKPAADRPEAAATSRPTDTDTDQPLN